VMERNRVLYDCCQNDCVVFRKTSDHDLSEAIVCPECVTPRFAGSLEHGTRIPHKVFMHMPVRDSVRLLYAQRHLAKHLPIDHTRCRPPFLRPRDTVWSDIYWGLSGVL
jgi:hypothetical protein